MIWNDKILFSFILKSPCCYSVYEKMTAFGHWSYCQLWATTVIKKENSPLKIGTKHTEGWQYALAARGSPVLGVLSGSKKNLFENEIFLSWVADNEPVEKLNHLKMGF